jgi:hypothetical protein
LHNSLTITFKIDDTNFSSELEKTKMPTVFDYHNSNDGFSQPICNMEDSHLKNTIALYLRKMYQANMVLVSSGGTNLDPVSARMFKDVNQSLLKDAEKAFTQAQIAVQVYCFEYFVIRNIHDEQLIKLAQSVFMRTARVNLNPVMAIEGFEEYESDDTYQNDEGLKDQF